ncbi:unnamed protein product [Oikopleura dioica]|uniref:Uncharacterized protein n=1 Tax=Oikopleura dioica TaxID=34765 RepID=E4YAQ5_OIKDI|nr:unnamed protein product [Oikopleura dioica]
MDEWTYFQCQLEVNEPVVYRIEAGVRSGQKIQLDDVSLVDRECYQEHFQLKNFTNWFAENQSSAYVYSPILKASTGHTYQVKITRGSSSLSTTVYLTNHANDNPDVFWPWVEQYVKIYLIEHRRTPVKDQMNHNYVWLTPDYESSANQKPTSERNPSHALITF